MKLRFHHKATQIWSILTKLLNITYKQDSKHSVNSIVYINEETQELSQGHQNHGQKLGSKKKNWVQRQTTVN